MKKKINKVVLINPPISQEQLYGSFAVWGGITPPTGLCSIAAYIRKKGYNVSIVDGEALNLNTIQTTEKALNYKPDIIGIACKTLWIRSGHQVARFIKKVVENIPIVVGGNHVTAIPERSLIEFPCFDIIVRGEGEITFFKMLEAMNNNKSLGDVDGLSFRCDSKIIITRERKRIKNIDMLPLPAWDLLPKITRYYHPSLHLIKKLPGFSIVTSRGCPHSCAFCDKAVFGRKVTYHSPEYIMNMIDELYYNYGMRHILFEDDNLLFNKKHIKSFLSLLEKAKLNLNFSCLTRVDSVDYDIIRNLKRAGCWQIQLGIESGSQIILDAMNKNITIKQIKKAIRIIRRAGIKIMAFFILGFPGETVETLNETVSFIENEELDDVGVFFFNPYPGANIYNGITEMGIFHEDWDKMSTMDADIFIPYGLTKDILIKYSNLCYDTCLMKFKQIIFMYRRVTSLSHLKALVKTIPKMVLGIY